MIFKDIKPDLIYVELQSVIKDLINTIDASQVETTDKEIATLSRNLLNELDAKPWETLKAANAMNGVLAVAGIAFEAWDSYQESKKQDEFKQAVKKMVNNFNIQREELLELVNG